MSVRSAQSITRTFVTQNSAGAATNADSTPTGVLYVNGTANGATVTITNITTGLYKAVVTLPSLSIGDGVELVISATVAAVAGKGMVWRDMRDFDLNSSGSIATIDVALQDGIVVDSFSGGGALGQIENAVWDAAGTNHVALGTFGPLLDVAVSSVGGGGTGSGDTAVDHNGAVGVTVDGVASATDCMQFKIGASGADDVEVVAFLKADYDAGLRDTANRQGTTQTGSDGRWVEPLMLDAGTYTILASKDKYVVKSVTVVVP